MNIFKRIFKIGQAEAHSTVDKLEDPIKMTEQGIRDMKADLEKSLKALAEVKSLAIRARDDAESNKNKAKDYENKAMLLLKRAQSGDMEMAEADRLATEALVKKEECLQQTSRANAQQNKFEENVAALNANIKTIRGNISKWENELKTLKARVKVSSATKTLNKQLAQIDSSSTVSMLEKMKDKVAREEAIAESYGEIAQESRSVDEEIDKALAGAGHDRAVEDLGALKKKLGIIKKDDEETEGK
ncbi:PspA/IM30 family protein [Fulvivirgaceae bacterium BMA12]|uniref:PspA/IM30 family protein n=1 Tax=Agaribacillus aureus TaxID=3051825 RepID=A0ABT8L0S0_9BACT|nr:PspA/IM30 family protein [Fulvivirgaceae bacterium BMA12]